MPAVQPQQNVISLDLARSGMNQWCRVGFPRALRSGESRRFTSGGSRIKVGKLPESSQVLMRTALCLSVHREAAAVASAAHTDERVFSLVTRLGTKSLKINRAASFSTKSVAFLSSGGRDQYYPTTRQRCCAADQHQGGSNWLAPPCRRFISRRPPRATDWPITFLQSLFVCR